MKQLVIPKDLLPTVLNFIHDCATSSHPGKEKAYKQAQLKYYWTDSGNKFKVQHLDTGDISVRHADELKRTNMNEIEEHTLMDRKETGRQTN